jgi:membrane protein DedA with SNARE-associated domain
VKAGNFPTHRMQHLPLDRIGQFIAHYGYFALFGLLMLGIVGPLIPDETILVFAGIAIHKGQLQPVPTLLVTCAGSMCGITLSYILGRTGVVYALKHIPPLERHVASHIPAAQGWFERFGKWTLFFGYFIAGVRHFTALVAGTSGLRPGTFAMYSYPGGFIWVTCFLTVGYYLGEEWERVGRRFDIAAMSAAAVVAISGFIWWRYRRSGS